MLTWILFSWAPDFSDETLQIFFDETLILFKGKFLCLVIFEEFHDILCTVIIKNHKIFSKFVQSHSENPKVPNHLFSYFPSYSTI